MSPTKPTSSGKPQGAQQWIVATLRGLPAGARLSTSRLAKKIAKASGRKFHENSVYNALRSLVRTGAIGMVRSGREKLYYVKETIARGRARAAAKIAPVAARPSPASGVVPPPLPHRLGLGDILILRIDNGVMLSATNLHGKLVFERHKLDEQ